MATTPVLKLSDFTVSNGENASINTSNNTFNLSLKSKWNGNNTGYIKIAIPNSLIGNGSLTSATISYYAYGSDTGNANSKATVKAGYINSSGSVVYSSTTYSAPKGSYDSSPFTFSISSLKDHKYNGQYYLVIGGVNNINAAANTIYYKEIGITLNFDCAHIYDSGVVTKNANCTTAGVKTFTCTVSGCGGTYTESIPATGHSWNDPTYTWSADGKTCTAKRVCGRCGATETATATITSKVKTAATCEGKGTTTYTATFGVSWATTRTKDVQDIAAKGHTEVTIPAVAPTCTATGLTAGKKCSVCGAVLVAQQTIPALGHSFTNYKSDNNATCTEDGTKTAKCDRCDVTDTVVDVGSAKGHNFVEIARTPATCIKTGSVTMQCSCGETQVIELPIDPDNHSGMLRIDNSITVTCETDGYTGDLYCNDCGALRQKGEVVPATGHHLVVKKIVSPTENNSGYTIYYCDNTFHDFALNEYYDDYIHPVKIILLDSESVQYVNRGESITFEAPAVDGYEFIEWSDGNTDNPRTVTVTGKATYQAVYERLSQVYSAKSLAQPYSGNAKIAVYVGNTKI